MMTDIPESVQRVMAARRQTAAANASVTRETKPDDYARAVEIAQKFGLPPAVVHRNRPAFESRVRLDAAKQAIEADPVLAGWMGDYNNAAIAGDDIVNLRALSKIFKPDTAASDATINIYQGLSGEKVTLPDALKPQDAATIIATNAGKPSEVKATFLNSVGSLLQEFPAMFGEQILGGATALLDGMNFKRANPESGRYLRGRPYDVDGRPRYLPEGHADTAIRTATDAISESRLKRELKKPVFATQTGQGLYSGASSLLNMIPAIAVGISSRGASVPVLGTVGAQTFGQSYGGYRADGADPGLAFKGAAGQAGVEVATELLPLGAVVKTLGDAGAKKYLTGVLRYAASELPGEQVATLAQDAIDTQMLIETGKATPQEAWQAYRDSRGDAAYQTLVAALVPGATFGAVATGFSVAERVQQKRQAKADAAMLDALNGVAAESKVRLRNPDALAAFLQQHTQGGAQETIHIPAEKLVELYQSEGYDWGTLEPENDPLFGWQDDIVEQIRESLATGGNVTLKTADVVARLAGSQALDKLKDDAKFSPGGLSVNEADALNDVDLEQAGADVREGIDAAEQAAEPAQQVYDRMYDQFRMAGYTIETSRQYAALYQQRYATRGARTGTDALTALDKSNPEINRVLPEAVSRFEAADDMDLLLEAARKGVDQVSDARMFGPSLLEFIANRGGVYDGKSGDSLGGDLKSMGAETWHRDKKFRKKLLRDDPGRNNANTIDDLALAAWEAGYFGDVQERPSKSDMIDLIGRELGGQQVYSSREGVDDNGVPALKRQLAEAVDELSAVLDQIGVSLDASNAEIKKALKTWQEQQAEGQTFNQEDGPDGELGGPARKAGAGTPDGAVRDQPIPKSGDNINMTLGEAKAARGSVTFAPNRTLIKLFEASDLSTLLHESGHMWLEELRFDAMDPAATDQLKADYATLRAWWAENGIDVGETEAIPEAAHELTARGFERYVMEGKAPSTGLRKAFEAFRSWLLRIYQTVARLKAPITPEVRDVFNRMLATDEEIAAVSEQDRITALFPDAATAGMTEDEFATYQIATGKARDDASDALLYRTMEAVRRKRTQEWKREEAVVRADVTERVNQRREHQALYYLRNGRALGSDKGTAVNRVRMNRDAVLAVLGENEAALKLLPGNVPAIYTETGGEHPDMVAEMFGYPTGRALLDDLIGMETRQREMKASGDKRSVRQAEIDAETAAIMTERHGDPLSDGSIEEEARAALHNEQSLEVMAMEVRSLARERNLEPTPVQAARAWAARAIAGKKVADATALNRYSSAERKAARGLESAILSGNREEAYKFAQQRMLSHALYMEAKQASEDVDRAVKLMARYAKAKTLKSMDQDYLDQIHDLIDRFNFGYASRRAVEKRASLAEWAIARQNEGHDVVVPEKLLNEAFRTHYSRMTIEELRGLHDSVKQIAHLGRHKQKLLDGKEARDFAELVDEAVTQLGTLRQIPKSDLYEPGLADAAKAKVLAADASLLKMESVFDWADAKSPTGLFNRVVFRRIAEAQGRAGDMIQEYNDALKKLLDGVGREQRAGWMRMIDVPELINPETGNPFQMNKATLIAAALNTGNASNLDKLLRGYRWTKLGLNAALDRYMTKADWDYVQGVWDTIDSLWPEIEAMEKRLNGVAPERIEPVEVVTRHGTYRGGYYPVVYDSTRDGETAKQAQKGSTDLFENIYTRASTPRGFTKERTSVARPIHLSLAVIPRHISEVIHDLTHREAVMDADRFLSNEKVAKAFTDTFGPDIQQQFRPWLQGIANEWAQDRAQVAGWDRFFRTVRTHTTIVGLGFRVSTVILQSVGYSNSAEVIGAKWLASGFRSWGSRDNATAFVRERSAEMRARWDTLDRDIRESVRKATGKETVLTQARLFAFYGITMADQLVTMPTWLGAYNKGLAEGMPEPDAVYYADKVVRQSQGAGGAKDLSSIQRSKGFAQAVTIFYSYFNAYYNRQRDLGRDVRAATVRDFPRLLARSWWLMMVPPVLSALLSGNGPEEDEDWGAWAAQKIWWNLFMGVPIARDLAGSADSGYSYKLSPLERPFKLTYGTVKDFWEAGTGEDELSDKWLKNSLETTGYAFGLPLGQIGATTQFLWDVIRGEQDPDGVAEWYRGLTKGDADKQQ